MVVVKGKLIVGIPRGPNVLVISRIKLSEICNMDQSLILFEYYLNILKAVYMLRRVHKLSS